MIRRRLTIVLLALTAVVGITACGSSSSASSSSSVGAAGAAPSGAPSDIVQHARVKLAECMRAHGVDVPDAAATGTAGARTAILQLLSKYSQTQLQAAANDCKADLVKSFPELNLSPAQLAQRKREALAFVQCLRAHGINLPDPVANGLRVGILRALSTVDTDSPAFQKANTACASLRPARLAPG